MKQRSKSKKKWIISGVLPVIMCVLLMTGMPGGRIASAEEKAEAPVRAETGADENGSGETEIDVEAPDFTLRDQYGTEHTLSQYRGKVVFLNFWATWCPSCIAEMPGIEELYHELGENQEDVVILGIASPLVIDTKDEAGVISFLEEHGWTYPVLMDKTGEQFVTYSAEMLPTSWLIRKDGMIMGYIPGALSKKDMLKLIQITAEYESGK